ncbi:Aste57867_17166 [Aphanomyces stellatus]|uniref:Aste57867_17166 protein n=1 Tax=Aphanomyces stellatus TaxID=120398 RepID=A0A485L8Y7_9STRA|nr:hypothetical protein As57867_017107 [Aphanomyces stellatus]VFT93923.1 Aste57867_17166 [Aphanomyces stellatus]
MPTHAMEIGSRIVTKRKPKDASRRSILTPGQAPQVTRPQSAKLNAKFGDLTLQPTETTKKKRSRPTTARPRDPRFQPDYPQHESLQYNMLQVDENDNGDPLQPNATGAATLWSDDDDEDGDAVLDVEHALNPALMIPSCSKLKMLVVQAILEREECITTLHSGMREGWSPARLRTLVPALRMQSLAVVECVMSWKAAAADRCFLWDGASYLQKMVYDTDVLDPLLSRELGFDLVNNPFLSSVTLDAPQLKLLVACHTQNQDVVHCIARRVHFGTEDAPVDIATRLVLAMVAIVKEDMELQLQATLKDDAAWQPRPSAHHSNKKTKDRHRHQPPSKEKFRLDLSSATSSCAQDTSDAPASTEHSSRHRQGQRRTPATPTYSSPMATTPNLGRLSKQGAAAKSPPASTRTSARGLTSRVDKRRGKVDGGDDDNDDDRGHKLDLQHIFNLCNDVTSAASHLEKQMDVLETAQLAAVDPNAPRLVVPAPRASVEGLNIETRTTRRETTNRVHECAAMENPSTDTTLLRQDKDDLDVYMQELSARIATLKTLGNGGDEEERDPPEAILTRKSPGHRREAEGPTTRAANRRKSPTVQQQQTKQKTPKSVKKEKRREHDDASAPLAVDDDITWILANAAPASNDPPHNNVAAATTPPSVSSRPTATKSPKRLQRTDHTSTKKKKKTSMSTEQPAPVEVLLAPNVRGVKVKAYAHDGQPPESGAVQTKATIASDVVVPAHVSTAKAGSQNNSEVSRPHRRTSAAASHRARCVLQHRAAVKLQAWWRGQSVRRARHRHRRREAFAVATIEDFWRAHVCRRRQRQKENARRHEEHNHAATKLQTWQRRRAVTMRQDAAARQLQRQWRHYDATQRAALQQQHKASRRIQSTWRGRRRRRCVDPPSPEQPPPPHASTSSSPRPRRSLSPARTRDLVSHILGTAWELYCARYNAASVIQSCYWTYKFNQQHARLFSPPSADTAVASYQPTHSADADGIQDQYATDEFEDDVAPQPDDTDVHPQVLLAKYFVEWMTNRLRRIQYRELARRARLERLRQSFACWHVTSRASCRVRLAFVGWRDQALLERTKRVQTRAEFAQSAKAWKKMQGNVDRSKKQPTSGSSDTHNT